MQINYRPATTGDLEEMKGLAIKSWGQFEPVLTPENWEKLHGSLNDDATYKELLGTASVTIATDGQNKIIGMVFLVPHGNPTDIYDKDWSYIRFLTVDPEYGKLGIGKNLTQICIHKAKQNGETAIALHTSEMMDAARHIYEGLGFRILKEIDQRLGKRYWLYILKLKD